MGRAFAMNDAMDRALEMISSQKEAEEQFRIRGGFYIAGLAVILAIASVLGNNAGQDILRYSVEAADGYSFFQAKNIRQTNYALQLDELKLMLAGDTGNLTQAQRDSLNTLISKYSATIARYDSEPDPSDPTNPLKGEGKKELLAQAQALEAKRDLADARNENYDYASVFLQIAIVILSASIIIVSRPLLIVALILAAIGVFFIMNGLFLFLPLPI